ncbi:DNA ligase D [Schauerella aestuarii]|uniref:DNA ligase D n=1 Tax=Schauerella aestuarii TaxID=2511204 RepID=UPI00137052E3|nr:DNA ligase D [Achromobacter aestuarii]MYZ43534.1 DNA ligase D [Achromobacter aestuarii]
MADTLQRYREKRNFGITSEPAEGGTANDDARAFVIQKHWASRLHYDLRLELDGAMKSWAVPKGPSYDVADKRMAVQVEDHPIAYNQFEGEIPKGQYGAGRVIIWDEGVWVPLEDPVEGYQRGMLKFELHGVKMRGKWALIRMKGKGEKQPPWLLIKEKDAFVKPAAEFSVVDEMPDSVVPLRAEVKKARAQQAKAATAAKTAKATTAKGATAKGATAKGAGAAEAKASKADRAKTSAASDASKASGAKAATATSKRAKAAVKKALDGDPDASTAVAEDSAGRLPGEAAPLPDLLKPQLATLVDAPPPNPKDWLFEVKFDGYRIGARLDGKRVQLFTRNGHDWTHKLQHLADALATMKTGKAWLDGEIVVLGDNGAPSFQALQNAFDSSKTGNIAYYVFDAPFLAGRDLRGETLMTRRALLEQIFDDDSPDLVRFSGAFDVRPQDLVTSACKMGLEGVIGKLRDSTYVSRRSPAWIKLKCGQRQEFVVVGYTQPKGTRVGLGALLIAVHDDDGALRFAGSVGSGFDDRGLTEIKQKLDAIAVDKSPFSARTPVDRTAQWVKPQLLAEVSFSEWTSSGSIRHPVFKGLRSDKPAKAIGREKPVPAKEVVAKLNAATPDDSESTMKKTSATTKAKKSAKKATTGKATAKKAPAKKAPAKKATPKKATAAPASPAKTATKKSSAKLTHPERVIDSSTGLTKLDLAEYYARVSPLLLPHLKARPVSLVRAPGGIEKELFFQKHLEAPMPGVKPLDPKLDPDHPPLLEVPTAQALMSAVQMNTVEFHTWNAVKTAIDKPDRMTFDLDPGEGIKWPAMVQAAQLVRVMLTEIGLTSWIKTSGGKGLHVVVPLKKQYGWDTVKSFSQAIVQHLARTLPKLFVAKSGPKNRVGKIFVDYLRNGFGATTASAWSARARPGMGVSVPIEWDEVEGISSGGHWTIANIDDRLDVGNHPWDDYAPQSVTGAMSTLDFKP